MDKNRPIPALVGPDAALALRDAAQARADADNAMDVDDDDKNENESEDKDKSESSSPVKLVVMDGIVVGPNHCAYDNCSNDLVNARQGVFCAIHEKTMYNKCHIKGCDNNKIELTQTCQAHQNIWSQYIIQFGQQSLLGIQRLLRGTQEEAQSWLPTITHQTQAHDDPVTTNQTCNNYFTPSHYYCIETLCALCGVVIAWTKFDKAESLTNILNWLNEVYPTADVRPNYVCIDKACVVLRTAITSRFWDMWKETTRFIVDSYHYINHRTTDYLSRKWCNLAPLNGSAPNLVVVETDRQGIQHYKRAFNTQVSL